MNPVDSKKNQANNNTTQPPKKRRKRRRNCIYRVKFVAPSSLLALATRGI